MYYIFKQPQKQNIFHKWSYSFSFIIVLSFPARNVFIRLIKLLPSKTIHPFKKVYIP